MSYYLSSDKKQNWENPVTQSHGPKVMLINMTMVARLPIKAKPSKDGGAKPSV